MHVRFSEEMYFRENQSIFPCKYKKCQGYDRLCDYGCDSSTHDPHSRKWSETENKNRIQNDIDDQTGCGSEKSSLAVSKCRKDSGKALIHKGKYNQTTSDLEIDFRIGDNLWTVQIEKTD